MHIVPSHDLLLVLLYGVVLDNLCLMRMGVLYDKDQGMLISLRSFVGGFDWCIFRVASLSDGMDVSSNG